MRLQHCLNDPCDRSGVDERSVHLHNYSSNALGSEDFFTKAVKILPARFSSVNKTDPRLKYKEG